MSMKESEAEDFKPWWLRKPKLRKLLSIPLYFVNKEYRKWRSAKLTPSKKRQRLRELDRKFPRRKEELIGRDREYQLIMSAIGFHVIRNREVRGSFKVPLRLSSSYSKVLR